MRVSETNQYWKAAHSHARVTYLDLNRFIASDVITLFDTGASSGNYVSQLFIQKHNLQHLLTPVGKSVKVANGEIVDIVSQVMLQVSFSSSMA